MIILKKKLCERCNQVEIKKINKYCDTCRPIVRKELEDKSYRKNGIGIYKITNIVNNKIYIGQSVILRKRILMHKNQLKRNNHENIYLQRAFNKYGESSFTFEIIEHCSESELYPKENYWIIHYQSHIANYGYNIVLPSADEVKYRITDETRNKIADRNKMFDDEDLISYLQEFYYHNGRVVTSSELNESGNLPSRKTYENRFGSFKEALIVADLYDFVEAGRVFDITNGYSRDELLNKFQSFIDENKRFPNNIELKNAKENNIPNYEAILKHFTSTEELKTYFGFDKESILQREKNESLNMLMKLYKQCGKVTSKLIRESDFTRSDAYYVKNFSSLNNACKLAGIPDESCIKRNTTYIETMKNNDKRFKYTLMDMSVEFKRVFDTFYNEHGKYPPRRTFDKLSNISISTYRGRLNKNYSEIQSHYNY